jgi:hypothetical protein
MDLPLDERKESFAQRQRAVKQAVRDAEMRRPATCHTFRHSSRRI